MAGIVKAAQVAISATKRHGDHKGDPRIRLIGSSTAPSTARHDAATAHRGRRRAASISIGVHASGKRSAEQGMKLMLRQQRRCDRLQCWSH